MAAPPKWIRGECQLRFIALVVVMSVTLPGLGLIAAVVPLVSSPDVFAQRRLAAALGTLCIAVNLLMTYRYYAGAWTFVGHYDPDARYLY